MKRNLTQYCGTFLEHMKNTKKKHSMKLAALRIEIKLRGFPSKKRECCPLDVATKVTRLMALL